MTKIAGVVIAYHPDWTNLSANIQSYLVGLERLYIIDNSDQKIISIPSEFTQNPKISVLQDHRNEGIAKRLNWASKQAIQENYQWLLTMDQDSQFANNDFSLYLESIEAIKDKEKIAMFGIEHEKNGKSTVSNQWQSVDYLITSGSILNLSLFNEIGGFDEQLFIDSVDVDYCFAAKRKGFLIAKIPSIYMEHHLGMIAENTLGLKNRVLHSPIRLYYMTRNYVYMKKKYNSQFVAYFKILRTDLFNRIKNYLLLGKNKLQLIQLLRRAFRDAKQGNMGKLKH